MAVVKAPLRRVLRKSLLALDELSTILLEIERVVNDRPITYVAGVDEPPPVTPNMLAGSQIGRVDIQEESIGHKGANRRIQYLEQLREALTKRWEQEYIMALRSHHPVKNYSFAVDDIILLVDEKKKRQDWKLARIIKLFPGKDGHVRVVRLASGGQEFLRSVQRLVLLEVGRRDNQRSSPSHRRSIGESSWISAQQPKSSSEHHRGF